MLTRLPIYNAPEAFFRANIHHFLPEYPASGRGALYRSVCDRQARAAEDYHRIPAAQVTMLARQMGSWIHRIRARPGIIATYHTGSYRLLSLCLAAAGLPLALLVSGEVAARERETMLKRQQQLSADIPSTTSTPSSLPLVILEAEDPFVLRRTCRLLQQGYQIVLYADGNTGAAGGSSTHLLEQPFLAGHLLVRQGIPMLSFLSGVPIYPVRCEWGREGDAPPYFLQAGTIHPRQGENREAYARRTMGRLYAFLEKAVARDPATWECWRYLHQWVPTDTGNTLKLSGGAAGGLEEACTGGRLLLFRQEKKLYLLDAMHYIIYPIKTLL